MKTLKKTSLLVMVTLLALVLAACAGGVVDDGGGNAGGGGGIISANSLNGTHWVLVSYAGTPVIAGTTFTLNFEATQLGGSACNSYGGEYSLNGDKINVGSIVATEMYCTEPEGIMDQEMAYFELLSKGRTIELVDGKMTIFTEDGEDMVFDPAP